MSLTGALGGFAYRRRRVLLISFLLLSVGAGLYGRTAAESLTTGGFEDHSSESARASEFLDVRFGQGTPDVAIAYRHPTRTVFDPAFRRALAPLLARLASEPGVERVGTPYSQPPTALLSKDRRTVVVTLHLRGSEKEAQATFERLESMLRVPELQSLVGGAIPGARQAQEAAERDLIRAELITLPLLALLLVVFFRGIVAASLPLLVGGFAVAMALACLKLLTHATDISIFAMNIVTFVGLGLAIDYSLFVATRFREELAAGMPVETAIRHTFRTAGRTVAYSGIAVAVSLLGLLVFPIMVLRSIALAGSLVVVMSLLGSLVLLPALLSAFGHRIEPRRNAARRAPPTSRFWQRAAEAVMRAPVAVTVLVTVLLLALGAPFLRMQAAVSGAAVLPESAEARRLTELLESDLFPPEATTPVEVAARLPSEVLAPEGLLALERYVARLEQIPNVRGVDAVLGDQPGRSRKELVLSLESPAASQIRERFKPLAAGNDTSLRVRLDVPPTSQEAQEVVRAVRAVQIPGGETLVTGPAARLLDLKATLAEHFPWAFAIICSATFVVLFLAFGSVVMPLKAIVMNVLSLTASFGALVWIFQDGRFEALLNFRSPGNIELTIPVVMFAVVFGLAMDYELFLLSRIREAYDHTQDTRTSVAQGLEQTAQIITRAALLLVAVMIGFISADMLLVKELGVGMAIAIIVDATIVRALLVPATMQLLGHKNWWAPRPLARWWSRMHLGVDERSPEELEASEHGAPPSPA